MLKFLLKYIVNGAIVAVLLLYYTEISFWSAVLTATGLTVLAYLIGDQIILRATNNWFATACDIGLAAGYLGILSYFYDWELSLGETLFIAALIGVAEWFLHRHVFREELQV
ncbi:YndM family protein [Paenibacillus soyae]|uniref:YndM family protein n=1 Tax=Paenibacillus soyae TaxID=2969249 RepID=A0A9X2MPY6_9BACL|nr:YndM family protein [Paenibacillus soyae]MCR2804092.1 YndM family protein [Paenibacillus soyae]